MQRQEELRAQLRALGFDVVRYVRLDAPVRPSVAAFQRWLEQGMHADMDWIARGAAKRENPDLVLAGARSAILLGVNYGPGPAVAEGAPRWARYALYQDYHDTLKPALQSAGKCLEQLFAVRSDQYRYYVDTGPVLERSWAERGGLGFVGKNAMLISREFGNWLFLAEILTTLEFTPDAPLAPEKRGRATESRVGLHCGSCTQCIEACPTRAIRAPGVVDARRCISYQTIENKGVIPRELRAAIGTRIYGCDICLEVCPWNRFAQEGRSVLLASRHELAALSLRDLLSMTPQRFAELFRGTPMKRTKWAGVVRNACIVAANTRALGEVDLLVQLASADSALVRAHAVWAVFRLLGHAAAAERLELAREAERDPAVLAEYSAEDEMKLRS